LCSLLSAGLLHIQQKRRALVTFSLAVIAAKLAAYCSFILRSDRPIQALDRSPHLQSRDRSFPNVWLRNDAGKVQLFRAYRATLKIN